METIEKTEALKVWLEEYKVLCGDIQNRVTLQHGLMNFLLLIVSASTVVIASLLKDNLLLQYQHELRLIILTLPLLFSFFVWRHANHDLNIIDKATYINHTIRPHLISITGDTDVLGFERFLERARQRRNSDFGPLIWWSSEHSFHLLFSAIALIAAYIVFFSGRGTLSIATSTLETIQFAANDALLALDTILFFLTVRLREKVGRTYGTIAEMEDTPSLSKIEKTT